MRINRHVVSFLVVIVGLVPLTGLATEDSPTATPVNNAAETAESVDERPEAQPESVFVGTREPGPPETPPGIVAVAVDAFVTEVVPIVGRSPEPPPNLVLTETPVPVRSGPRPLSAPAGQEWVEALLAEGLTLEEAESFSPLIPAKSLATDFDTTDFETNSVNAGSYYIPPDPHGAAGPDHVINVTNVTIRFHHKGGALDLDSSLRNFFTVLNPVNATFDPKVIYDQFEDRWLVLTLERTTSPEGSRILIAVSDDADPNGAWTMASIPAMFNIGGINHWSDYPGFAVDEEAVYITVNLFSFPGVWGGNRLWVVDKQLGGGGFYDGGPLASSVVDPVPTGFYASTQQPAHIFGTAPAAVGTWLAMFSGLTDGVSEFLQLIRLDNPLTALTLTGQFINIGDIDSGSSSLQDAPQLGSSTAIETNDRRTLDAVWRDGSLWVTTTTDPPTGDPDAGQATAYWLELDTTNLAVALMADGGAIGGEDIAPSTHTFFPSIAVNHRGDVAIGFSASAESIYAGSYYTNHRSADSAGTVRPSKTLRAGLDSYVRTFGASRNRWGDYSGTAVDPVTACFWIYNEHAITRGSPTSPGNEDGRWGTAWGLFCSCEGDESTGDQDVDGVCDDIDACPGYDDALDGDGDNVPDDCDICPGSNDAADADADGVPDGCDICAGYDDSVDSDADSTPDGCDLCPGFDDSLDADADTVPDGCDVCSGFDDTLDADADNVPDGCDICSGSDDGVDTDGDGVPDGCDICSGSDDGVDTDGDGVPDGCDVCQGFDDSLDADADNVPDGCDICPGFDDGADADGDTVPDGCDVCPAGDDSIDTDGDGVADACDVCQGFDDSVDADGDTVPDGCDICPGSDDGVDTDGDGVPDGCDVCQGFDDSVDADGDTVPDGCDICPGSDDGVDTDGDGVPDGCDVCQGFDDSLDADGDTVPDGCDICPGFDDGADADGDTVPDGCDVCPAGDDSIDTDGDGVADACDICQGFDDSVDADGDTVPDGCDICPGSDDGVDTDGDGVPDGCDLCEGFNDGIDTDNDGVPDGCDVCPGENDLLDADADGVPDGCDVCSGFDDTVDTDNDGVADGCDVCPGFDDGVDSDGDGSPDGCDLCVGNDATGDGDLDGYCADTDCDDGNPGTWEFCMPFSDGFESGDTSAWSSTVE